MDSRRFIEEQVAELKKTVGSASVPAMIVGATRRSTSFGAASYTPASLITRGVEAEGSNPTAASAMR